MHKHDFYIYYLLGALKPGFHIVVIVVVQLATVGDSITTSVFPYSCNCNLGIDFPLVLRMSRSSDRPFMLKVR